MRYLGLDIGRKNIGLAIGEMLASEYSTIKALKNESFYETAAERAINEINDIIKKEEIDGLVVGLPVNEDGQATQESKEIEKFCQKLQTKTDMRVHFVNETLTSFMAEDMLEEQGASKQEAKEREHQLAAQLILQQYFEENSLSLT
jgi:putative Holliday junction resolvase